MLAEANTSALAPPTISSFSRPDGPNFACTLPPLSASNALATSVSAAAQAAGGMEQDGFGHAPALLMIASTQERKETAARITRPDRWRSDRTTARR